MTYSAMGLLPESSPDIDVGLVTARLLLEAGSIHISRDRPFLHATGWVSPVHVDSRRLHRDPAFRRGAVGILLEKLRQADLTFGAVAAGETAAILWASWLAERLSLPLLHLRQPPFDNGENADTEGRPLKNLQVLLINDLGAELEHSKFIIKELRSAGFFVNDILTLFCHRMFPEGVERLTQIGLRLHCMADWNDILRLEAVEPRLDVEARNILKDFVSDPMTWSAAHGGRARTIPLQIGTPH